MAKIHITGGLGFIGSNLVRLLNKKGVTPYIYDKHINENWNNVAGLSFSLRPVNDLYFEPVGADDILIHLGANVDTREKMNEGLWENNFTFTVLIAKRFSKVIYASSAATYGAEEENFKERIYSLKPLNAYGFSKWKLDEYFFGINAKPEQRPKHIYALRFFNVYGPNEVYKGDMQSVVSKALNKISPIYQGEAIIDHEVRQKYSLFKSDRLGVADGEQMRDFIFVEDVCKVINFLSLHEVESGIYNLGSGKARTFKDLILAVNPEASISFVDMPNSLKGQYQYFTQADMTKLRAAGYTAPFATLEEGVAKTKALTK